MLLFLGKGRRSVAAGEQACAVLPLMVVGSSKGHDVKAEVHASVQQGQNVRFNGGDLVDRPGDEQPNGRFVEDQAKRILPDFTVLEVDAVVVKAKAKHAGRRHQVLT